MHSFSLSETDEAILHWQDSPSIRDCDKIFQASLFSTISSGRAAALLRLSLVYRDNNLFTGDSLELIKLAQSELTPLFQQVSASVIQVVTNSIQNILSKQEEHMAGFIEFFNKYPGYAGIFGCLTFPAICFYFITKDFLEIGKRFIISAVNCCEGPISIHLIASFFDCFPDFTESLWTRFLEAKNTDDSVIHAFARSLSDSFAVLPSTHAALIAELLEDHKNFVILFLFSYYFPIHANSYFSEPINSQKQQIRDELHQIFGFIVANTESPIADYMVDALKSKTSYTDSIINYADTLMQTVHAVLSGYELQILFEAFKDCDLIKKVSKVASLSLPPEAKSSLAPGFVQYNHRKFLSALKNKTEALIFSDISPTTETYSTEFKRAWNQLDKMSNEECQNPLQLLNHPRSPQIYSAISKLGTIQTPEFYSFAVSKIKNRISKGQTAFERFIDWKTTENVLLSHKATYDREIQFFSVRAVWDFVQRKSKFLKVAPIPTNETQLLKSNLFQRYFSDNISPVPTTPQSDPQNGQLVVMGDFENAITSHVPIQPANELSFFFALEAANWWPVGPESTEETEDRFRAFLSAQRAQLLRESKALALRDRHMRQQLSRAADTDGPVGRRIDKTARVLSDVFLVCQHISPSPSYRFFAQSALDLLILCGRGNFLAELIWFERIASIMPDCIRAYRPRARELFAAVLNELVLRVGSCDRILLTMIADAVVNTPPGLKIK